MFSNWKKYVNKDVWENVFLGMYGFVLIYAAVVLIIAPFYVYEHTSLDASFIGITLIITAILFALLLSQEMKHMREQEECKEEDESEIEDYEEIFEDNAYDIREFMRECKEENLQEEVEFFSQIEGLLEDIEYIQRFEQIEEEEEEEIYKHTSSHLYSMLSSYVLLRKENRIQVINEFLPIVQEKRNALYYTYIEHHQKDMIKECQHHGEQLKETKREYLYIQE